MVTSTKIALFYQVFMGIGINNSNVAVIKYRVLGLGSTEYAGFKRLDY